MIVLEMCLEKSLVHRIPHRVTIAILITFTLYGIGCAQSPTSPTSERFPNELYELDKEMVIGEYGVCLWRSVNSEKRRYQGIVTISCNGKLLARHEWALGFGDLTGTDIIGNGNPNVIITLYSGGAHCCFETMIYDLGLILTEVPVSSSPQGNCHGTFQDLDGDGIYEIVTCDDAFAYRYCAYAYSPAVRVILKYEAEVGYVPASPKFAYLYADDIDEHTQWAKRATRGDPINGWYNTSKCAVLPLVLDYLYSGRIEEAWQALYRYYTFPDIEEFRTDIQRVVHRSPYFVQTKVQAGEGRELAGHRETGNWRQ